MSSVIMLFKRGDVKGYAHITSGAYTKELQAIAYMKSVYEKGGWIIGGIRKIFYEKDSLKKCRGKIMNILSWVVLLFLLH